MNSVEYTSAECMISLEAFQKEKKVNQEAR